MRRRDLLKTAAMAPMLASAERRPEPVLEIGSNRQLFLDDWILSSREGLSLKLQTPRQAEIVMKVDKPWENEVAWASSVIRDDGKYRMWYRARQIEKSEGNNLHELTGYAESEDGIHWVKPELGLIEIDSSKKNNIVWGGPGGNMSVLKDTNPGVPESERYKAIVRTGGILGLVSEDGIHWRKVREERLMTDGQFDSHNLIFLDPWTRQYTYYGRGFVLLPEGPQPSRYGVRRIRRAVSDNFLKWSKPELIDMGAEPLDHLYTNGAVPYTRARGTYLMFPKRFVHDRTFVPENPNPGQSDVVFSFSRDGVKWSRAFLEAYLRPGLDIGNWHERAIMIGQGLVETGPSELSQYCFEHFRLKTCHVRRYTVRPDGFVSLHAPYRSGHAVTKPFTFRGGSLRINYATSAVGYVKVDVLDASGKPIEGMSGAASTEIFGDELNRNVVWKDETKVGALEGKPVRLRFQVSDADLFSFQIS